MHPVCILSSDNILKYPRTSRRNGCCSDQQSFHQLQKVLGENGLEWWAIVRKEHLGGTKRLKKLFKQRKMRSRPGYRQIIIWFANPLHWGAKSGNFGRKEIKGKVIRRVRSSVGFQLFFGQQSILAHHPPFTWQKVECTYSIKDSAGNILKGENEILSRCRKYFEDLLNPVKASTRDTHEMTYLREVEVFTAAEVATVITG